MAQDTPFSGCNLRLNQREAGIEGLWVSMGESVAFLLSSALVKDLRSLRDPTVLSWEVLSLS